MKKETVKSACIAIFSIILLYAFFAFAGIGCPIKFLTGISCAGCGMTRAWLHLFTGDFAGAFSYHPLVFVPLIVAVVFILGKRISDKLRYFILSIALILFIAVYFYRLYEPSDTIVSIDIKSAFIYKLIERMHTL